ncbi:MAG: GntR family transcriptional regulator [Micropepsaceae bacterium]
MQTNLIQKPNLADAATTAIRSLIMEGRLPDGERINEVHLSEQLGVSRTPLREALSRLASEGSIEAKPRFGFYVRPLTTEEFTQVYDLRPIFDPAALKLAGLPSDRQIARLDHLNRKLARLVEPDEIIETDDEWHMELLAHCPNRALVEIIENIIQRTRRYEMALMRETQNVTNASLEHAQIISELRARNLKGACAVLEQNMRTGKAPILAWLKAREAKMGTRS